MATAAAVERPAARFAKDNAGALTRFAASRVSRLAAPRPNDPPVIGSRTTAALPCAAGRM